MRTPVLHTPRAVLALIFLVGLHVPAHADTTPENLPPQKAPAVGVDLDFPGGTLGDLADLLRKETTAADRFNLIVESHYRKMTIPAIHVRNADPFALTDVLNLILRPQGVVIHTHDYRDSWTSGAPVFVLVEVKPKQTEVVFRSYAIAELLDRYEPEQIASALRTAWELDPANDPAALLLKYHPETRLLFVSGPIGSTFHIKGGQARYTGAVIDLADEVIANLKRQKDLPKAAAPEAPAAVAPQ